MGDAPAVPAQLDFGSPLYLHPSENASSTLLLVVFDGTGYRSWRRAVLRALSVKSKTGFITGKVVKPASTDPSFMQWERCDDMVTSWILNNAKELWDELEDRYDQTNGCKLYQLQKEINDLVQGTLDVTGYYTKMKKLWEEMSTLDVHSQCSCVCVCGGKAKMHQAEQDRRLVHFLMGLNEMYTVVRGSILMMSTLPSMAQAFAILSQEERQREVRPHNHTILESTSLNASVSSNVAAGSKGNSRTSNKSNLFCDFCKRTGHIKDRCYKLHGYPSNSRPFKGRSSGSAANVYSSEEDMNRNEVLDESMKQMPVNLSKGQYEQLLNLLGSLQAGNGTDGSGDMLSGAVNLAGPFSEEPSGTW
ncbi:uncharacterized protein LOC125808697 [Solanum verrucosum]|uniref:uncharacterized protein LOC125808697 n=1 Tax=Solanum verrucosum TaxID=315347 RepID=UPI0020D19B48|nr:uncharacterized protein LOC125808697 [Solanum verrucosum]